LKEDEMLLGIDFGTTRTVVAAVDRGNYPVVSFQAPGGDTHEWYPSLMGVRDGVRVFGFEAAAAQNEPGSLIIRSFKRELAALGPDSAAIPGERVPTALELLTEFLAQLARELRESSNLRLGAQEKLEAMISVPANANSNQRFITMEAFRRAGFLVRGMINEPSAAGVEYAHHYHSTGAASRRDHVVVYDLGGGTFDASVISMAERQHEVVSSDGIAQLGGDDFDQLLLEMATGRAGIRELTEEQRVRLLEECREKKEGLHANTRKIVIELERVIGGAGEVILSAAEFYERCRPLVEQTVSSMEKAMERSPAGAELDWRSVAAVYMVGGSINLPLVARMLRERYGRQVRKSPYPHAAAAIGLAIAADAGVGYQLRERFTRHFGVWRETLDGRAVALDVLFEKETLLPEKNQKLTRARRYRPTHNIGHFRFLECSRIDGDGHPTGDITPWDELYFPFDPELRNEAQLETIAVKRTAPGEQLIEELYSCDENGIIEVSIIDHTNRYQRTYRIHGSHTVARAVQ
jgi:molecular chaperone DnaK (HSP70)